MAAKVLTMPTRELQTPWAVLGFETERDMLLDDLKALDKRLKDSGTPAHAIAALSKRKNEIFEQIKNLDSGDDEDDILDDSEDEEWNAGS